MGKHRPRETVERVARALCDFENKVAREQCGPDAVQYRYEDWRVEFDRKARAVLDGFLADPEALQTQGS